MLTIFVIILLYIVSLSALYAYSFCIFEIETDNRIIPILRFQSTYELCPENISTLEKLFQNEK